MWVHFTRSFSRQNEQIVCDVGWGEVQKPERPFLAAPAETVITSASSFAVSPDRLNWFPRGLKVYENSLAELSWYS